MGRRLDTIASRTVRAAAVCAAALALSIVMTWPLASGFGRLGRTTTMDGLYSIWNISWVAHATISRSRRPARREHLLSPSPRAHLFGGEHPRRRSRQSGMVADRKPICGTQRRSDVCVLLDPHRHLAARAAPLSEQWRGGRLGDPVCVLSVLLLAQCPHPVAHGRRHSPRHAGAPSPRRQSLTGTWRGARTGTRGAGTRLRVLRHLCRSDGRLRRRVPGRIETSLGSQAVLGGARDRGRHLDRGRAPVLPAVPDDATRRRLPAFAR